MADDVTSYETKNFIIKIDRSKCISCGTCAAIAPDTFEIDDDFKPFVKKDAKELSIEEFKEVIQGCSVGAITVIDKRTDKEV